jgi:hypothetical protein
MADQKASSGSTQLNMPKVPPGTLIGQEVSYRPKLEVDTAEVNALRELSRTIFNRDMPARREEVIRIWEKRLFDRGLQHLLPRRGGGWEIPGAGTGYNPGDEENQQSIFEINVYSPYNLIIIGALTREIPKTRFQSVDPDDDAGITAAENADKLEEKVERNNNMMGLMAQMARYLCTDGRALFITGYWKDGQRFGFEDQELEAEERATVPETEEKISAEEEGEDVSTDTEEDAMVDQTDVAVSAGSENAGEEGSEGEGTAGEEEAVAIPRGRELICVKGALESKLPIKSESLAECSYCQVSEEIDLQIARAKHPEVADDIHAGSASPGGDDIDRLARINTKLGVFYQFLTTDTEQFDTTEQTTWLRPAALLEIHDEVVRTSLLKKAGAIGLRMIFCGTTFCEVRQIGMDEQLTLIFAHPGDGMHRPGITDWLMPVQKLVNNLTELANDYFVHGVPATFMDDEIFDIQKLRDQVNMVGARYPFTREEGVPLEQAIWQEQPVVFPTNLFEMIQDLKGQTAELLSGAFTALSGGGDASATDTYGGMLVQRDQALGRIGIAWRNIKEGISNVKRQAVMCLANNEERPIKIQKGDEAITIQAEDLKGNFLAYPATDENFPESHTAVQNRLTALWTDATSNPTVGEFLYTPDNLEVFLHAFGVKGFYLPQVAARDKQLGEIVELLAGAPIPNPKIKQARIQLQQLQAEAASNPDPAIQTQIAAVTKLATGLPLMVSSVEIGRYDDNDIEFKTCVKILNSARGRKLKNGTDAEQMGYKNLELHASEHEAALAAKQDQVPQGKPPTKSIALKDLPPGPAAALAKQGGIPATAQDFQAEEAAEAVSKHPGPGGVRVQ